MTRQPPDSEPGSERERYDRVYNSAEFARLRRRFRAFVFPVTAAFLVWYMLYVLAANYAPEFMAIRLFGNINVALVFGLLQFVSTFGVAGWYARKASRDFDPLAARLGREFREDG